MPNNTSYKTDSKKNASGHDRQSPKSLPATAFGTVAQPAPKAIQSKGSTQIILHGTISASFHFGVATASAGTIADDVPLTNTSCVGGTVSTIGTSNVVADDGDAGIKVPVNANVWSASAAAPTQGAVTFVYRGGL